MRSSASYQSQIDAQQRILPERDRCAAVHPIRARLMRSSASYQSQIDAQQRIVIQ
jgi:hypothetical protein